MEDEDHRLSEEQLALKEKYLLQAGPYRLLQPGAVGRPVGQFYHQGYLRQLYLDTWELVPVPRLPLHLPFSYKERPVKSASKKRKGEPQPLSMIARLFARDKGCVRCGHADIRALSRHHVVHRFYGGGHDLDNLQLLCFDCHQYVHNVQRLPSGVKVVREQNPERYEVARVRLKKERRERVDRMLREQSAHISV